MSLRWAPPSNEDVSEELENPSVGIDTPLPEDSTYIAEYSSALEIHELQVAVAHFLIKDCTLTDLKRILERYKFTNLKRLLNLTVL